MAYDKVIDSTLLDAGLTATANAIRAKTGSGSPIVWDSANGFKAAVEGIDTEGGVELPELGDTAAQPSDIVKGKVLYNDQGNPVIGNLVEIPAGRTLPGNTEQHVYEVSDKIAAQGVLAGEAVGDGVVVRPGANIVVRVPKSEFGNASATDVAKGKTFTSVSGLKVIGTHECEGGIDTSDATATAADMLAGATAYVNGEKIEGTLIEIPAGHSIAGSTEKRVVEASGNIVSIGTLGENVGSGCIVRPGTQIIARIPKKEYGTATAADVAKGKTFTSTAGFLVEGMHECEGGIDVSKGNVQPYEMSQGKIAYTKDGEVVGTLVEVPYDETEAAKIFTTGDYAKVQKSGDLIVNLGRYASASIGDNTKGIILRPGAIIGARMPAEMYGDATENDVREGVTFTSENGVKLTGKASFDDSNGSSLPSGISNIKTGVWVPTQDYNTDYELNHNLGTIPDLFYIYQDETDIFVPSSNKGYINCETLIFKPQPSASAYGTGLITCGNSSGTNTSSYALDIAASPTNSMISVKASNTYKFKAGTSYRWIAISF